MKKYIYTIICVVVIAGIIVAVLFSNSNNEDVGKNNNTANINNANSTNNQSKTSNSSPVEVEKDSEGNAIIDTTSISDKASFYTYTLDGVKIRIFAVKATDGTIRTAFNTCQVCNPSPKAYFVQKGSNFECQNCGNLFATNKIGIEKGGCNPIPITTADRTQKDDKIIINKSFISEYKENFETLE